MATSSDKWQRIANLSSAIYQIPGIRYPVKKQDAPMINLTDGNISIKSILSTIRQNNIEIEDSKAREFFQQLLEYDLITLKGK